MQIINEKISSDVVVNDELELTGTILGDVEVKENAEFTIKGTIVGDLMINENGNVILYGTIIGDVINNGGNLEVHGVINGSLTRISGITNIDSKAVINF